MKNFLFVAFFAAFFTIELLAQNSITDSLKRATVSAKHDTIRINLFLDIGEQFANDNPDSALLYYRKGLQQAELKNYKKQKSSALSRIGYIYRKQGDFQKSIEAYINALSIDEEMGDKYGIAKNYNNIGLVHYELSNYEKAIDFLSKSLAIKEEIDDKKGIAASHGNIGIVYKNQGYFDKAIEQYLKALKILEDLQDNDGISKCYNNIGSIYYSQANFEKALEYYNKSLSIDEKTGDKRGLSRSYNNIGIIYKEQKNFVKALEYYHKALEISIFLGDKKTIAINYNNIGNIHRSMRNFDKTVEYYQKSLKIREEIGDKRGLSSIFASMAELNKELADSSSGSKRSNFLIAALKNGHKAYDIAVEIGSLPHQRSVSGILREIYEKNGQYREALMFANLHYSLNDSIYNQEKTKALTEIQTKYETEKKQQEIEKQQLVIDKNKIELRQQHTRLNFFIIGSFLLGVLALVIFIAYRQKNTSNKIITEKNALLEQYNEEIKATSEALAQQNEQLKLQNEEITKQRNEIEQQRNALANLAWELREKGEEIEKQSSILTLQNKEITDSIIYARRIQSALLPSPVIMKQLFTDHFILYKPKSIVSGDFYWATKIRDLLIFCVTDCTGHGVPGAFMSMMGISFLNEIVRKEGITDAAQVLNQLRGHILASMVECEDSYLKLDGMDMGLCVLNSQTLTLQYAGANISCWIAATLPSSQTSRNRIEQHNGLVEIKPDCMPIARYERMVPFTYVDYQLVSGDVVYLATDGFSDQFGGSEGKKFQKTRLMELIGENSKLTLAEQKIVLDNTFEEWKNSRSQLDDVTILGVKV